MKPFIPFCPASRSRISLARIPRPRTSHFGALSYLAAALAFGALAAPVGAQPPTVDMEDVLQGVTGETAAARYQKAWKELRALHEEAETTAPATTIALYRQFLVQNPRVTPGVGVEVYERIALMLSQRMGKDDQAHQTFLDARQLYAQDPFALLDAVENHANWLNSVKRSPEALELLRAHWDKVQKSWTHLAMPLIEQRELALRTLGQNRAHQEFLEGVLRDFPELVGGEKANWDTLSYERLMTSLLESKGQDAPNGDAAQGEATQKMRALGWAKLRFMSAPYESGAITRASQMLTRIWAEVQPEKTALIGFAAAQKNAELPNPLRDVKLPPLEIEDFSAHLEGLGEGGSVAKITLLLWAQKPASAMRLAQKGFESRDKDEAARGTLEVARVFKAHDLNLLRANAFLAWSVKKEGPNPIEAFLKTLQVAPETDEDKEKTF